jgi:hypothetical protein
MILRLTVLASLISVSARGQFLSGREARNSAKGFAPPALQ